jgi:hypothetical protein
MMDGPQAFTQHQVVTTTLREVHTTNRHDWSGRLD